MPNPPMRYLANEKLNTCEVTFDHVGGGLKGPVRSGDTQVGRQ